MEINLTNKIALVTGGTKGLGKAVVNGLIASGAKVCFTSRSKDEIESSIAHQKKNSFPIHSDMSSTLGIQKTYDYILDKFGTLDTSKFNSVFLKISIILSLNLKST